MKSAAFNNQHDKIKPLLSAKGEMSQRILEYNWAKTVLGSVEMWPQSLLTTLGIILHSSFPMLLLWGEDLILFYNDAYRPSLGQNGKHPEALGQSAFIHWTEVWSTAYPLLEKVLSTGDPHFSENHLVPIFRNGKIEDAYWTYSYSAVFGDTGKIDGILVVCNETTKNITALKEISQTQKRVIESENKLRNIILKAPVAMCIFKSQSHIIDMANDRMFAVWGTSADQVLNKPVFNALGETKSNSLLKILDHVYTTGKTYSANECPRILPEHINGALVYENFVYEALKDEDGVITGVIAVAIDVTEHVNTKQKIVKNEAQFRLAIEGADFGLYDFYPQTGELNWSDKTKKFFGLPPDSIIDYSTFLKALHPEDKERTLAVIEKSMRPDSGGLYENEYRVIGIEDGITRWIRSKGKIEFDRGKPLRFAGINQDITERKNAEQNLRMVKEQLEITFQSTPIAICLFGEKGEIIFANDNAAHLAGFKTAKEFVDEKDLSVLQKTASQVYDILNENLEPFPIDQTPTSVTLRTGKPAEGIFLCVRKSDKTDLWLLTKATPILDDNGEMLMILTSATDITLQKKAEVEIRNSEQRFRTLAETLPQLIWITNRYGEQEYASIRWKEYTGIEPSGMDTWQQIVHPDDLPVISKAWLESTSNGTFYKSEARLKNKTGEYRWHFVHGEPIRNEHGEIIKWIGAFTDVHEQKQTENTLRYRTALLEAHNQSSIDGILLVGENGKIISYNQRFLDIWKTPQHIMEAKDDEAALLFGMKQLVNPQQFIERVKWQYEHPTQKSIDELEFIDGRIVERYGYPVIGEDGTYYAWSWTFRDITEQKTIGKAIKESEERFRALADQSPMIVYMVEPNEEATISYFNKTWLDYTGRNLEESIARAWDEIVHPEDLKGVLDIYVPSFKSRVSYILPAVRLKRRDGQYRWHMFQGNPRYLPNGEFMGFIGVGFDIHERKLTEDALKENESRFRTLANSIPQLAWMTDAEGWIYWYNQRWFDYTGTTLEEVQGWGWQSVHHPDMVDGVKVRFKKAIESGKDWEDTFLLRGKDGQYRWFLSRAHPIRNSAGQIIQWFGTNTDVSAQRESEERFRNLADQSPMWVWMADENVYVTYANTELLSFVGILDCKDFTGMVWEKFVHPEDVSRIHDVFSNAYKIVKPYQLECRFKNAATQHYEWFYVKGVPRYEQNKFAGFVGTAINIHEQKILTEALESRVLERTKQLEDVNTSLANTNKELEQFAYVASHDLQEPLRKIRTFIGLISQKDHALNETTKVYLQKITNSSERMMNLIKDLLNHSSIKWAEQSFVPVDLNEILANIKTDLELLIIQKGANFTCETLPIIDAIPLQMRQLFFNLINNSLKFSKDSITPHINITCRNLTEEEKSNFALKKDVVYHYIMFQDNGVGFSQIYANKIFDIFQRLHDRQVFSGSGIGLALCKKIAENHRGLIYAESKEGEGASFFVILPSDQKKIVNG